jgi:chromatin remodeling complex protein RSC6
MAPPSQETEPPAIPVRFEILADDKLEAMFGKKKVTMFEMNKYLTQHLTSPEAG